MFGIVNNSKAVLMIFNTAHFADAVGVRAAAMKQLQASSVAYTPHNTLRDAVKEAIERCEGNFEATYLNLMKALHTTLGKHSLLNDAMEANVSWLDELPDVAADLHCKLVDQG